MFVISLLKHMFPVSGPKPIARTLIPFLDTGETAPDPAQNFTRASASVCHLQYINIALARDTPCPFNHRIDPPACRRVHPAGVTCARRLQMVEQAGYKHRQPFIRPEVNPRALIMVERPGNQTTQGAARSLALTTQPYNVIINAIYTFPCPVGCRPMAWIPTKVG